MHFFGRASVVLTLASLSLAQDFSVDIAWRKFSNNRPLSERIDISQKAISKMLTQLGSVGEFNGIGYWQSGNVWSTISIKDKLAGQTTNKDIVVKNLKAVFSAHQNFDKFGPYFADHAFFRYNDDALWWAHAAVYAHRAYNVPELVDDAIATWNQVTKYAITPEQANTARSPVKNFALAGSCNGATMAGGVFWRPVADDTAINSITTGLYMSLSAYLAEIKGDVKYKNAAIASATWIKTQTLGSNNIVLDSVSGANCARSPNTWIFTYNSGKFIEGLSVLADVTKDDQWKKLMENVLTAAVKNRSWQGANGIITEGSDNTKNNDGIGFKAIFIRGLLMAHSRSQNRDLQILVHSYNDVQYNALLDLAGNGDFYSANWLGPKPDSFTAWGQLAALDPLVTSILTN